MHTGHVHMANTETCVPLMLMFAAKVRLRNLSGTVLTRYYREIFMEFVSVCPCKSDTSDTMAVFWTVFHDLDLPLRPLIKKRTNYGYSNH